MGSKTLNDIPALYETYFLRDLTYTASGAIVVAATTLTTCGSLIPLIRLLERHFAAAVGLLITSYVVGLLLQEGLTMAKVFQTEPAIPNGFTTRHFLMAKIADRFGQAGVREIERTIYLKHVGSSLGSAFLVCLLLLVIAARAHCRPEYLLGLIPSGLLFAICFKLNRKKHDEQEKALEEFAKRFRARKVEGG